MLAALALPGAAACSEAKAGVEPLPPVERPTPEQRAGLPVLSGRWLFTGFEYPARDTLRVREQVYRLVPPGEFRIVTQRLDSISGQYVRDSVPFPMTGEVRRDGIFSFVAMEPTGGGQFVAGRVVKDTMWIELTGFPSAGSWPPGTRAALVRQPRGAPFVRLRGYVPPPPPPGDSAKTEGTGEDGDDRPATPPPSAPPAPVTEQPRPRPAPPPPPPPPPPPAEFPVEPIEPVDTFTPVAPPVQQPRQRGRRRQPEPVVPITPPPPPPVEDPRYQMPRDTIRIGTPAR